jgi:fibronectin-binding autotransporter adhesin
MYLLFQRKRSRPHHAGPLAGFLILLLTTLAGTKAASATTLTWTSGVSGLISDASKWTPSIVPGVNDRLTFSPSGTYTVTFPSAVPRTSAVTMTNGTVIFNASSPHTTGALTVYPASIANSLTLSQGSFNADFLELGSSGFNTLYVASDIRASKTATLHSKGTGNPHGNGGDVIGYNGISEMYVTGGGRYICESTSAGTGLLRMAELASSAATLSVSGAASFFPQTVSSLQLTGGAALTVGVNGSANLFASNKGYIDVTGDMMIATAVGSNGYVTIGPSSSGTSSLYAHQRLLIGANGTTTVPAGGGELTVKNNSWVRVDGTCEVSDPDGDLNDPSLQPSVLRVQQGGTFTTMGGLKTRGLGSVELQGGLMHVVGGRFEVFGGLLGITISSQTGTPELRISNQISNQVGLHGFYLGRSGYGMVHLIGSGLGAGNTVLGDSVGGVGTIVADSTGGFSCYSLDVGKRGQGTLKLLAGSTGFFGGFGGTEGQLANVTIGAFPGSIGQIEISGRYGPIGSTFHLDNGKLWIGGGPVGPGGTGTVTLGNGGLIHMIDPEGQNPLPITIYGAGTLTIESGGTLIAGFGSMYNQGNLILHGGDILMDGVEVSPTGNLTGYGSMTTALQNNGVIDPSTTTGSMGMLKVQGSFQQSATGHYRVNLDTSGGQVSDLLMISGNATLDGTLDITTAPGFTGSPGQTFPILFCSSVSRTFAAVTWNGHPLNGEATIQYGAELVNVVMPGVSGVGSPGSTPELPSMLHFTPSGTYEHPEFALDLPDVAQVIVKVFDVRGREIATLFEGTLDPGRRRFHLAGGSLRLASGTYFGRATVEIAGRTTVRTARTVLIH